MVAEEGRLEEAVVVVEEGLVEEAVVVVKNPVAAAGGEGPVQQVVSYGAWDSQGRVAPYFFYTVKYHFSKFFPAPFRVRDEVLSGDLVKYYHSEGFYQMGKIQLLPGGDGKFQQKRGLDGILESPMEVKERYAGAIRSAVHGFAAKKVSNRVCADWYDDVWTEEVRLDRLMKALLHKIVSDYELLVLLLEQRGGFVECSLKDSFWGIGADILGQEDPWGFGALWARERANHVCYNPQRCACMGGVFRM